LLNISNFLNLIFEFQLHKYFRVWAAICINLVFGHRNKGRLFS